MTKKKGKGKRIKSIYLFTCIHKRNHFYFLQCAETGKYLAKTSRSEFLLNFKDTTHTSVTPVSFATWHDAIKHAKSQTRKNRQSLVVRPIADFFAQYIVGCVLALPNSQKPDTYVGIDLNTSKNQNFAGWAS